MQRISMIAICAAAALLLSSALPAAAPEQTTRNEIEHLFSYLAESGCRFNRNGSWYSAAEARDHLQRKYDYLRKKNLLPDTEAFIERAASESSSSGRAYQVQCGQHKPVNSGPWFRAQLARYRAQTK